MRNFKKGLLSYATIAATGILVSAGVLPGSYGGGCALASKKIYCYGGSVVPDGYYGFSPNPNFFALDVSGPINTAANVSSWQSVVSSGDVRPTPNILFGTAAVPSGDGFVISGGIGYNDGNALSYPTMLYNATNNAWTSISTNFLQSAMPAMATDYKNGHQVFMYGGRSAENTGYTNNNETETYSSQGIILDYQSSIFNWIVGPEFLLASGIVSGRMRHSAVQGADGKFYIIGGEYSQYTVNTSNVPAVTYSVSAANMTEVLVYDIGTGWTTVSTNGAVPTPRWHHTTTLLPSGKILLLGGCRASYYSVNDSYMFMVPSSDYMFTLDTTTMTWFDQTSAVQAAPGGAAVASQQVARCYHQSVLVGEESLFVLNGRVDRGEFADTFYILNTTSWVLSNSFPGLDVPPPTSGNNPPTNNPGTPNPTKEGDEQSTTLSGGAIAGIVVGVVAGIGLILVAAYFWRRHKRNSHPYNSDHFQKEGQLKLPSNTDSSYSPAGYSDGSPTVDQSTSSASVSPGYGLAVKPEANDDIRTGGMAGQKIILSAVKPDGR